jgi:sterol 24-C-methyltransferase
MTNISQLYSKQKCDEVTTFVSTRQQAKDPTIAEKYYDVVTDFYEFGWGKSFHFAPQTPAENWRDAMLRHELKLASALKLKPGMRVLDVGCGVAGPMKNIASHSGASVVGININAYQIAKAQRYIKQSGLEKTCTFVQGNFMQVDLPDASFDAIYAIEATPHAPDKTKCFKELYRLLKPGGFFAGYEYALLPNYDGKNPEHGEIIENLEYGACVQKTLTVAEVERAFVDAGFDIAKLEDACGKGQTWTLPLERGWRSSKVARSLTNVLVRVLEFVGASPKGSSSVSTFLNIGADAYVAAGQRRIFTPALFFLVQKPT